MRAQVETRSQAREIVAPTVHLNGTAGAVLSEAFSDAAHAIDTAIAKLAESAPNGRDYYVGEPGDLERATAEYVARVRALEAVRDELTALMECVEDQRAERERNRLPR